MKIHFEKQFVPHPTYSSACSQVNSFQLVLSDLYHQTSKYPLSAPKGRESHGAGHTALCVAPGAEWGWTDGCYLRASCSWIYKGNFLSKITVMENAPSWVSKLPLPGIFPNTPVQERPTRQRRLDYNYIICNSTSLWIYITLLFKFPGASSIHLCYVTWN